MSTEYVLTALPFSVDQQARFHVSIVVSPRLTPSGKLSDFPIFDRWPKQLAGAEVILTDHTNQPFTIDVLPPGDPTHWRAVFPARTPVTSFVPQTFADKEWYSYPAAKMDNLAKIVHVLSLASSPVDAPLPHQSALAVAITNLANQLWRVYDHDRDRRGRLDERRLTRYLDDLLRDPAGVEDAQLQMLLDVHRVRRFYERPESEQPEYLTTPDPDAVSVPPKPIEPDFHQRVALLADQPAVLRDLGLVIDVAVRELDRLAAARWLTARVVMAGGTDPTVPTRVACQVDDGVFTTVPRSGDWNGGRLRLADANRFTLLDLDPDASGLKLDRFLVSVPRMSDVQGNDDPVSVAPATLRAQGFAVARTERVDQLTDHLAQHQQRADALGTATPPLLNTEDVTRGNRVEVWDDGAQAWFSLHLRSNDLQLGSSATLAVEREEGFLQGASASETPADRVKPGTTPKTYLGEVMFGWSGWSLSAPHPALRPEFRYDGPEGDGADRSEEVGEPPTAPAKNSTNVVSRLKVLPGTLPRLRYGRSYSFRAWGVDLAGNTPPRPDVVGGQPDGLGPVPVAAAAEPAPEPEAGALADAWATPVDPYTELVRQWRAESRRLDALAAPVDAGVDLTQPARIARAATNPSDADVDLDVLLAALVAERRRGLASAPSLASRAERVRRAVRPLLEADDRLVAPLLADASSTALVAASGGLTMAADTVTALRTLLRWHPVEPPAVVPKRAYGEGESVRHLVIRSGVDVIPDSVNGDAITVVDPLTYAQQVEAAHPELHYEATSVRHLAPPKVSQPEAELHGAFDVAIGSDDLDDHRTALLAALREAGTFFDRTIPNIHDPADPIVVDYLRLEAGPNADPLQFVDLDDLQPGDPIGTGQYLVADTDDLVLPYLPDPLAAGFSLRFPDAGRDRPKLQFPGGVEGVVTPLHGQWPELEPYRLVLRDGDTATGVVGEDVIDIALPPGDTLRARLACSLDPASLALFGLWQLLPQAVRDDLDLAQAAADGWLWALTPSDEVRLVHAVPRPLAAPRPTTIIPIRSEASTAVFLLGGVDVDGATTSRLDADASWQEWVDDPIQPAPERRSFSATAFTTEVGATEDLLILFGVDQTLTVPSEGVVRLHASRHELGDTKHRVIDYRFRGTSRFVEYFHPSLVAQPEDRSVSGPTVQLSLPSTARPPKPVVSEVVPLFRWQASVEPEQPFALRRTRRAGVRIYLDRGWYATGDDELLAVICAPSADDSSLDTKVSQWGADPVWHQRGPAVRPVLLELDHLFHQMGFDDRDEAAYPVGPARSHPLVDLEGTVVTVLGYRPQFEHGQGRWFADIAIDPGSAFWPFVRLVVARYQPESIGELHLSQTVRLDYVQVVPTRTATLSRVAGDRAHVVVTGPVGHYGEDGALPFAQVKAAIDRSRILVARLEQRDPAIATDLGWTTTQTTLLSLAGFDPTTWVAAWEGALPVPASLPLQQPGQSQDWRVTVEEFELFHSDRSGPFALQLPEPRIIYADHLPL